MCRAGEGEGGVPITPADWLGATGVAILLIAFVLNLAGRLSAAGRPYQAMNFLGAGLACAAAAMIPFVPFVVLEGTWSLVALVALVTGRGGIAGAGG